MNQTTYFEKDDLSGTKINEQDINLFGHILSNSESNEIPKSFVSFLDLYDQSQSLSKPERIELSKIFENLINIFNSIDNESDWSELAETVEKLKFHENSNTAAITRCLHYINAMISDQESKFTHEFGNAIHRIGGG